MKFEFEKSVKVNKLIVDWDLYSFLVDDGEITQDSYDMAEFTLTMAAIEALESHDYNIFYKAANLLANLGASDTEPRRQFAKLWQEAYGEEV